MNNANARTSGVVALLMRYRRLVLPVAAASLIFVLLVPLPTMVMDILLAGSLALAAVILLTTIFVASPLEFSVFPTVLLGVTLFRLVLNIATTRLILTAGRDGGDLASAQFAAGEVIWAFSHFVTYGSLAVGVILFAMIFLIQFIVITKGAARISEVTARFVLDAMPGKQMAIDADLNAKLITRDQARRRRDQIAAEADFFGAMDGVSRFLRGDALAALIITIVNILGGLYVGIVQYGWDTGRTVELFTRLTVGDGLVAQVPALLVSISAAIIVSRSSVRTDLGEEVARQLTAKPVALVITAAFLAALAFTSLPKVPLLLLGFACVGLALTFSGRESETDEPPAESATGGNDTAEAEKLLTVEPMRIDIGYALVCLVAPSEGGRLLDRIAALRKQIAGELGLLVPPIQIRDEMRLGARQYAIRIRGTKVAEGTLWPGQLLAVAGERSAGKLIGRETTEPTFGTPAVWIGPEARAQAEMMNHTLVEPDNVLLTHLGETIRRHAPELLSRAQVAKMLDQLAGTSETLVAEARQKLSTGGIHRIMQNLISERVPIRDPEAILEAATTAETLDPDQLTSHVRQALARTISQQYSASDGVLWCVSADDSLVEAIGAHTEQLASRRVLTMPPAVSRRITEALGRGLDRLRSEGRRPVVVCAPHVRPHLCRLVRSAHPDAAVLGFNEIQSVKVQSIDSVGIEP